MNSLSETTEEAISSLASDVRGRGPSAALFEAQQDQICLKRLSCEDLLIDDGVDIKINTRGETLSTDIEIFDFFASCSGKVEVEVAGVQVQAFVEAEIVAPSVQLTANLGEIVAIDDCAATIEIDSIEVSDLRIVDVDIPDKLTDTVVEQVEDAVLEVVNEQAGDGKEFVPFFVFIATCANYLCCVAVCDSLDNPVVGILRDLTGFRRRQLRNALPGDLRQLQNLDATIRLREGFCKDITVDEVFAKSNQKTRQALNVPIEVDTIETFCYGTVDFAIVGFEGSLDFVAEVRVPQTKVDVLLLSTDLSKEFPSTGCVTDCSTYVRVDSLHFDDFYVKRLPHEIVEVIVEALEEPVADVVEELGGEGAYLPDSTFDTCSPWQR